MKIILLGAPGAGKGTQAQIISEKLSLPIIGTGNLIRAALKDGSEMGQLLKSFMDAGKLVPDEVVVKMVAERLQANDCKSGYILDGFPRTLAQAKAFEEMGGEIDIVLDFDIADEVIAGRLSGRRICANCGATYHMEHHKPNTEGKCDLCGGELIRRKDDEPATIAARFEVYHAETAPLKGYYANTGKLVVINAHGSVEDTTAQVLKLLEAK